MECVDPVESIHLFNPLERNYFHAIVTRAQSLYLILYSVVKNGGCKTVAVHSQEVRCVNWNAPAAQDVKRTNLCGYVFAESAISFRADLFLISPGRDKRLRPGL